MKDMLQKLGGSLWALFLALSAVVTVVGAFSMPAFVDVTNPWALLVGAAIVFALGFANGWKQRGFRNVSDAQAEAEMERLERDAQAERERLAAETQARIERENREHEEMMEREREQREAEKARKETEKEAREEREERKAKMRRAFVNGDYGTKLVVKMAYEHSPMDVGESFKRYTNTSFFMFETIGDGRYRCDVSDMMREVIEETPDIMDFCAIPEDVEATEWLLDEINGFAEKHWFRY